MKPRSLQSWLRIKPLVVAAEGNVHAANVLKEAIEAIHLASNALSAAQVLVNALAIPTAGPKKGLTERRQERRRMIRLARANMALGLATVEHLYVQPPSFAPKPKPKQETETETMIRRLNADLAPGDELVMVERTTEFEPPPGCDCAANLPGNDPSQHALTCSMYRA